MPKPEHSLAEAKEKPPKRKEIELVQMLKDEAGSIVNL